MKSFKFYLLESKDRFIKKNKNLTRHQQKELIKFFSMNRQAESKVDWNKAHIMTYDEFEVIMTQTRSGRQTKLKHHSLKGLKEGTDYVHVRMKTKSYLAYIPLNYETAQKFNTKKLGVCQGDWCVGHSSTAIHWNDEVIEGEQIPIYVINTESKWIVMIKEGNRQFDVWDLRNNPSKTHEGIPYFSVRKELLSSGQKKMYDEIREEFFMEEEETIIDIDAAEEDYDRLINDIEEAESTWGRAGEEFYSVTEHIKSETISKMEIEKSSLEEEKDELESEMEIVHEKMNGEPDQIEEDDDDEEYYDFDGDLYTHDELDKIYDEAQDKVNVLDEEIIDIQSKIDEIEDIAAYEMNDYDVDWSEDPPTEDEVYDEINIPSVSDSDYSDYIEVMENHYGWSARHDGDKADGEIREYVTMEGSYNSSAESILQNSELYHPSVVNEN